MMTWRARVLLVVGLEPAFDVPIVNVTVVAGQTAVLPCSIEYLGKYKVTPDRVFIRYISSILNYSVCMGVC